MILRKVEGELVLSGRKYPGRKLVDIAQVDPSYITWVYESASISLPDDIFRELERVMEDNKVPPFVAASVNE